MTRIHPSIASHWLYILPSSRLVRQKVRRFHPDKQKINRDEVDKLLEAGFIREVEYPDWLANVVVVPKKEGKWRVCIDYTNLNNACPKDNAFSGYHQIPMASADEEKTTFIMPHGLYCYKVMPFGLKNVGATYQRLMTKNFRLLVGRIVEVYIDDIMVKSKTREDHARHLQEVFHLLRRYDMKLNPSKCAFGVSAGKFLGFMLRQSWKPPHTLRNKKELQRLTGKLVALGRFIARFTDKLRPFFLVLGKASTTRWTDNCQSAFENIKHYLTQPPILSNPQPGEKLYMYLAVSDWAASAVLFRCPMHKEQKHVYYVSRAMVDAETRYSKIEQTAIELSECGIEYQPRLSMKGQVMVDFVVESPLQPAKLHEGYYWPTMKKDAAAYVKKCDKCQRHAPVPHMPFETLKLISSPWPFAQWRMDIVGPLPIATAQKKSLLVATDYFTIIADNGPHVNNSVFQNFCSELKIQNLYSIPRYSQSNGQAEASNKTLLTALNKRLENTPFALAYGLDAVIPTKIGLPMIRTVVRGQSDESMKLGKNLDCVNEVREIFEIVILVLRKVFENTVVKGAGKFQENWEDPYIISKASERGV
uniref:Integrase catalytic domain-containing protein n=1 Tax=Vitis vinifera TaxID=29760 RepID=A5C198_VITVI|nr:hypothetical protein VITISV_030643 [Vitis vinifera]